MSVDTLVAPEPLGRSPAKLSFLVVAVVFLFAPTYGASGSDDEGERMAIDDRGRARDERGEPEFSFHIERTRVSDALIRFGEQAKLSVVIKHDARDIVTNELIGTYTIIDGLDLLLGDTALGYRLEEDGVVVSRLVSVTPVIRKPEATQTGRGTGRSVLAALAAVALSVFSPQGMAAEASGEAGAATDRVLEEIVVTARKRDELLKDTPVLINAFDHDQIERYRITSIDELAMFTPGLMTSERTSSGGGSIYLRGVGQDEAAFISEPSVAINIDGMQVGSANIRKVSQIDVAQIEVLRGPQALFFGKNSPGGVLSIKTADPTDTLFFEARTGYETASGDRYVQALVSGPLSENVGARLVGRFTDLDGYFDVKTVDAPGNPFVTPAHIDSWPHGEETFLRGTLTLRPSGRLDINGKWTYNKAAIDGGSATPLQRIICPAGVPQFQPPFPCEEGTNDIYLGGVPQFVVDLSPDSLTNRGIGLRDNIQHLGTLEIDYDLSDTLLLTSVSGYWSLDEDNSQNPSAGPAVTVWIPGILFDISQYTQEFRLASEYEGSVNFMLGAFAERKESDTGTDAIIVPFGLRFPRERVVEDQQAYSLFAQLQWEIDDRLEISGGLRYSYEKKEVEYTFDNVDVTGNLVRDADSWRNVSLELTLSYRFHESLLLFASYKEGFKSGGLDPGFTNGGILAPPYENGFDEEVVTGFEAGGKGYFLDDTLNVNFAVYAYDYEDLQVGGASGESLLTIRFIIKNAAKAEVRGAEGDFVWLPGVDGVTVRGALAYNDARFAEFLSDCYPGQSPAAGCNAGLVGGVYFKQDLGDKRKHSAPEWSGSLSVGYERQVSDGMMLDLFVGASYSGSYYGNLRRAPWDELDSYVKTNAAVRLSAIDERWEVSIVGRNLSDKITYDSTSGAVFTGGGTGTAAATLPDVTAFPSKGREVFLTLAYRLAR